MDGLLLLDKPPGWTSFDVVNKVRSLLAQETGQPRKKIKVGHTGTLDPMATGLLILTVGAYCKRAQEWSRQDKDYEGEITLGATSNTDDAEGEITETGQTKIPTPAEVVAALEAFTGEQMQVPPQFSALKVGGQRAYKQARKGQEVKLSARKTTVYALDMISYRYPKIEFRASVSSGTYIRSIARDIGQLFQTGGYLSVLRRTRVGQFLVSDALTIAELNKKPIQAQLIKA